MTFPSAKPPTVLRRLQVRLASFFLVRTLLAFVGVTALAALVCVYLDVALILPDKARAEAKWVLGLCGLAGILLGLRGLKNLREFQVALQLERDDPSLGSALTNAVQFSSLTSQNAVQEVLRARAVEWGRSKARALKAWPLARKAVLGAAAFAFAVLLAWSAAILFVPHVLQAVLPRFLDPFGDHPPYSRLHIEVHPGNTEVVYGSPCEVRATPTGLPVEKLYLVARIGKTTTRAVMFVSPDRTFFQTLANLREEAEYYVTDGRARSRRFRLSIRYTPRISRVEVLSVFPGYTGLAPRRAEWNEDTLSLPAETQLTWRVSSNRPLASGSLALTPLLGGKPQTVRLLPENEVTSVAGEFTLTHPVAFTLSITDVDGLISADSRHGRVMVLPDSRPRLAVLQPGRNAAATPDVVVPVVVQAEDDYAVTRVIWFRSLNRSIERSLEMELELQRGPARVEARGAFHLPELGVRPGDVILYFFEAVDNYPKGPNIITSRPYTLQIISVEEYQKILRQTAARKALFENYRKLGSWLRRMSERSRSLEKELKALEERGTNSDISSQERERLQKEAADLASEIARYQAALANSLQQPPLFDIENAFRQELERQRRSLDRLANTLKKMSSSQASAGDLGALALTLEELSLAEDERVRQPVEHIAAVVQLLARAQVFTRLALQQAELVRLSNRFESRGPEKLSRIEQMELQEIAQAQTNIQNGLDHLVQELPELRDRLPQNPAYDELRKSVNEFLDAVKQAEIQKDLGEAARKFSDLDGKEGLPPARDAAEKMDKLVARSGGMPGKGKQCLGLRFQPSTSDSLGSTLDQILAALSGADSGPGESDGYSLFQEEMGLYGPNAELAGLEASGEGPGDDGGKGEPATRTDAAALDSGSSSVGITTRVELQRDAKFPLRYRNLIGEYFRSVAESESGKKP